MADRSEIIAEIFALLNEHRAEFSEDDWHAIRKMSELLEQRETEWRPMSEAPKDGDDILICLPGGMSDHYYPVAWDEENGYWACRWNAEMIVTEEALANCHLAPMWKRLGHPPSSLCAGPGIRQPAEPI